MKVNKLWMSLALLAALALSPALMAATRSEFDKAVKQLQDSPHDTSLRKRIFKMAASMKNLPDIPDEVAILKGKAAYIVKNASSPSDFEPAVEAYKRATLLAPWVPELYYNLGIVQEKAGEPDDATDSFKLYLAADPEADDRDKVLARLGALEVQQEKQEQAGSQASSAREAGQADPAALRRWESQQGGQIAVGVVSGVTLGLGAVFLGIGLGDMSSATYTTSSGYYKGVLYNKYYDGKYFSSSSYKKYTDGETNMGLGWAFMGIGVLGLIITVAMDPGPKPTALLDIKNGDLALGLPRLDYNPAREAWQLGLLHAEF